MLTGLGGLHLISSYVVVRPGVGGKGGVWLVAAVAVGMRLAAWQLPAAVFSDDVYRYRWEGRLQAAGGNPYRVAPNEQGEAGRYPGDERVPGGDFRAVYGPVLLGIERATYAVVGERIEWWRGPAGLADLVAMVVLGWWVRQRGWPVERLAVYAWSPLPVLEFWWSGHHDAWIVGLLAFALVAHEREWRGWLMSALGLAALTKYWPLMLVPLFAGRQMRRWMWSGVIVLMAAVSWWWYGMGTPIETVENNARFATGFVGGWRNNDFLFGGLLGLTGDIYRAKYLAFGILGVAVVGLWWMRGRGETKSLAAIVVLLAVSANIHPWYGAWLLPFLIAAPEAAVLLWLALFPLFYETVMVYQATGAWQGVRELRWYVHGGAVIAAVAVAVLRSVKSRIREN